jgi:hypothetical protein
MSDKPHSGDEDNYATYCVRCDSNDWTATTDPNDALGAIPLILEGHSEVGLVCPACLTRPERSMAGFPLEGPVGT